MQQDGLHCPGCGFGFWYALGGLQALRPRGRLTAVSGGALAAACHLCGIDPEEQIPKCSALREGLVHSWNLHGTLRNWLHVALPEDSAERCAGRLVVYTRRYPFLDVRTFDAWRDRDHLVETLVAAASPVVPVCVDGEWLTDCVCVSLPGPHLPVVTRFSVPDEEACRRLIRAGELAAEQESQANNSRVSTCSRALDWSRGAVARLLTLRP